MIYKVSFYFLLLLCTANGCDNSYSCKRCVLANCEYVVNKAGKSYCTEDSEFISDVKTRVHFEERCAVAEKVIKAIGKIAVVSVAVPAFTVTPLSTTTTTEVPTTTKMATTEPTTTITTTKETTTTTKGPTTTEKPSTTTTQKSTTLSTTTTSKPTTVMTTATTISTTTEPMTMGTEKQTSTTTQQTTSTQKSTTVSTTTTSKPTTTVSTTTTKDPTTLLTTTERMTIPTSKFVVTRNTTVLYPSEQNEAPVVHSKFVQPTVAPNFPLSDERELFWKLPYTYDCKKGRNETLRVTYAASLCSIDLLTRRYGLKHFSDSDAAYLGSNPASKFFGTCFALRRYRKKCRSATERQTEKINVAHDGLVNGPRSALFQRVDSLQLCFDDRKKESLLDRLARVICWSGIVFLQLYETEELNNYDISFGLSNPSFRHQLKCQALFFRKKRCYN